MRPCLTVLLIWISAVCNAQRLIPYEIDMISQETESLLQPPYDSLLRIHELYQEDSVWDFSAEDTSRILHSRFFDTTLNAFHPNVNLVHCINDGRSMRFYSFQDSSLNLRGELFNLGVNTNCSDLWSFSFKTNLFGNGERIPTKQTKLYASDEFDYQWYDHTAGFPIDALARHRWEVAYGEKLLYRIQNGTLITPFDTLENCTQYLEVGIMEYHDKYGYYDNDKKGWIKTIEVYDFRFGYWYHPNLDVPVAVAKEWSRPLKDTTGHYVLTRVEILKYDNPEPIEPRIEACFVYPNPVTTNLRHAFDLGQPIQVFDVAGRQIPFEIRPDRLEFSNVEDRFLIIEGTCNGVVTRQKVLQVR